MGPDVRSNSNLSSGLKSRPRNCPYTLAARRSVVRVIDGRKFLTVNLPNSPPTSIVAGTWAGTSNTSITGTNARVARAATPGSKGVCRKRDLCPRQRSVAHTRHGANAQRCRAGRQSVKRNVISVCSCFMTLCSTAYRLENHFDAMLIP